MFISAITSVFGTAVAKLGGAATIALVSEAMQNPIVHAGQALTALPGRMMYALSGSVSESDVTAPMAKLINMIMWVFTGLGFILIAFGIFNFVSNMDGHDNSQKIRAGLTIGGGILLASIKGVISLLGISGSDQYLGG